MQLRKFLRRSWGRRPAEDFSKRPAEVFPKRLQLETSKRLQWETLSTVFGKKLPVTSVVNFSKGLQRKTSKRLHRKISVIDFSERLLNDISARDFSERQCRVDCLLTWLLLGAPWNLTESYPTNCGYTVPLPACCWRLLNLPFLLYFPASDICS